MVCPLSCQIFLVLQLNDLSFDSVSGLSLRLRKEQAGVFSEFLVNFPQLIHLLLEVLEVDNLFLIVPLLLLTLLQLCLQLSD